MNLKYLEEHELGMRVKGVTSVGNYLILKGDDVLFVRKSRDSRIYNIIKMHRSDFSDLLTTLQKFSEIRNMFAAESNIEIEKVIVPNIYYDTYYSIIFNFDTGQVIVREYGSLPGQHRDALSQLDVATSFQMSAAPETMAHAIIEYTNNCRGKVKCIIEGQELYLSRESVEALKKLK